MAVKNENCCKNCTRREVGCHTGCVDYLVYSFAKSEENKIISREKITSAYVGESWHRAEQHLITQKRVRTGNGTYMCINKSNCCVTQ